jgi:hypothetical protein
MVSDVAKLGIIGVAGIFGWACYKLNSLRKIVQRQRSCSLAKSIWYTGSLLQRSFVFWAYSRVYGVRKLREMYVCDYVHNDQWYSCPLPIRRGPPSDKIIQYCNITKNGVVRECTEMIKMLAGPNLDFHKQRVTPHMLGGEKVTIVTTSDDCSSRDEYVYQATEPLAIPN